MSAKRLKNNEEIQSLIDASVTGFVTSTEVLDMIEQYAATNKTHQIKYDYIYEVFDEELEETTYSGVRVKHNDLVLPVGAMATSDCKDYLYNKVYGADVYTTSGWETAAECIENLEGDDSTICFVFYDEVGDEGYYAHCYQVGEYLTRYVQVPMDEVESIEDIAE